MPDNIQEQNEFNDSLYQKDNKKTIKWVVIILAALLVLGGVLFIFLRKKIEPINTQIENTRVTDIPAVSGITNEEELKEEGILAQFAADKDRDGLSAEKEKEFGTSDYDSDTDWDGISDKDEIEKWKTDPIKADTDGDGFNDGFEIAGGFNPKGPGKLSF